MYFKINRDTPTGQKVVELHNRMVACNDAAKALVDELGGGSKIVSTSRYAAGGLYGIQYKEQPDGWKKVYDHHEGNFYYPKATKANLPLRLRLANLPVVTREEIAHLVGFQDQIVGTRWIYTVGFVFGDNEYLFSTDDEAEFTPNDDMIELKASEYKALKESILADKQTTPIP